MTTRLRLREENLCRKNIETVMPRLSMITIGRLTSILFVAGSLALARAGSGTATDATPLRVGVTASFPPMIYKEGGQLVGVEADFAKALEDLVTNLGP